MKLFLFTIFSSILLLGNAVLLGNRNEIKRGLLLKKESKLLTPSLNNEDTSKEEDEQKEIDKGTLDALKGEEASLHDDSDMAQHEFDVGASRLEAASNDADAEKDTDATAVKRQKDEHALAQRLEHLAEENRRRSAEKIANISPPKDEQEGEKKNESHRKKSAPQDEEDEDENEVHDEVDSDNEAKPEKISKSKRKAHSDDNAEEKWSISDDDNDDAETF